MLNRSGPNHCSIRSASLKALNTSSRGASNSRSIKKSCLPFSAVIVVLFPIVLFVYRDQYLVEAVKAVFPHLLERCQPVGYFFHFLRLEVVVDLSSGRFR